MKLLFFCFLILSFNYLPAQNIGIGTNNPQRAKLEVHGSVGTTSAIFGGDTTGISLQSNWPTIGFNEYYNGGHRYIAKGFAAQQFVDPVLGYMAFDFFSSGNANALATGQKRALALTRSADMFVSDGTGHLCINTPLITDPNYSAVLQIRQSSGNGRGIALINGFTPDTWRISTVVGSPPYLELDFNGIVKGIFKSVTGEYLSISDRRLKKDVTDIPSILDKVMRLQPVEYKMTEQNPANEKFFGFIAQDVNQVFPELVSIMPSRSEHYKEITDLHTLNYSGFGVLAIKAIQEQQQMIDDLKKSSELQKQMNEALLRKIKMLESLVKPVTYND